MRKTLFYACSKCNEVGFYQTWNDGRDNDFPRGEFMVHRDFMVTGIETKAEAEEWLVWLNTPEPKPPTPNMPKV